jgi:tetratricopeptide (TPR) repeat protein
VPGWHNATKDLQADGSVQMVGIIQEQHPDRARLFMQWKEMGWPILVDSYDLLEAPYVPITLALDEQGVIRKVLPAMREDGSVPDDFVAETFGSRPGEPAPPMARPDVRALFEDARSEGTAEAWKAFADAIAVWGGAGRVDQAIDAYEQALNAEPEDGMTHFRLGVAYRMRYDSPGRREGDFQRAVDEWTAALEIDPNQYIWRRRMQQYGPRLDKPYPFYDWVVTAREEITARGDEPEPLAVEPRGSEFASPEREFVANVDATSEPDPLGRVLRDEDQFIEVEAVAVPARIAPGGVTRLHFSFRPIARTKAHWNNEAEEMVVWLAPPDGWEVETRLYSHPLPPETVSLETRVIEAEVRAPEELGRRAVSIPGYALYYVCEDVNGICMYRRQDLAVEVRPGG